MAAPAADEPPTQANFSVCVKVLFPALRIYLNQELKIAPQFFSSLYSTLSFADSTKSVWMYESSIQTFGTLSQASIYLLQVAEATNAETVTSLSAELQSFLEPAQSASEPVETPAAGQSVLFDHTFNLTATANAALEQVRFGPSLEPALSAYAFLNRKRTFNHLILAPTPVPGTPRRADARLRIRSLRRR